MLDNALKYSPPGSAISCRSEVEGETFLIRVEDHGPGVPERDRQRIFEKFYRRPGTRDRVPGTGMGLYIAREITRMHGGELSVEDATPQGAAFCFRLPLRGDSRT